MERDETAVPRITVPVRRVVVCTQELSEVVNHIAPYPNRKQRVLRYDDAAVRSVRLASAIPSCTANRRVGRIGRRRYGPALVEKLPRFVRERRERARLLKDQCVAQRLRCDQGSLRCIAGHEDDRRILLQCGDFGVCSRSIELWHDNVKE